MQHILDFEKPIYEIEQQIEQLKAAEKSDESSPELNKLEKKLAKMRKSVFGNLTPYQRVKLCRHLERPFALDYITRIFDDFVELAGDRRFGDDQSIVGGLAQMDGRSFVVVGHQRGRTVQERLKRNFGMAQPEGQRKAQRLYEMAEKFSIPLILLVDTQGAYPGD